MSHKDKICQPALVGHVETCHDQYSYTPLIIKRDIYEPLPNRPGVKHLVEGQIEEQLKPKLEEIGKERRKFKELLEDQMDKAFDEACESKAERKSRIKPSAIRDVKTEALRLIDKKLENDYNDVQESLKAEIIEASDGSLDIGKPQRLIEKLETPIKEKVDVILADDLDFLPIPRHSTYELDGLGMFFNEIVCHRSEGLLYSPCGKEITILPGEFINEKNVLTTTVSEENSTERTTSEDLTTTNRVNNSESFNNSYEKELHKETDLNITAEGSFSLKPFKWLGINLSAKGNYDMSSILDEVSKTSHSHTKKRFDEVVRKFKSSERSTNSNSLTTNEVLAFDRSWKNDSDEPKTYIKRKSYCKTSVIHKRTNVQLAWNGCIENPARDLCNPDNIEDKHADEIQAIKDKWSVAAAPGHFGPRPEGKKECTSVYYKKWGRAFIGVREGLGHFQFTIDNGWSYEGGSASVQIIEKDGELDKAPIIFIQPNHGARGSVNFKSQVIIKNNRGSEFVKYKVCFNIIPDAAKEWDDQVGAWRDEQAKKEINVFIEAKTKELTKFLASDQARASIERRIMEDFFGVTPIEDCCKLIARLKRLFDFESMAFTLLPSWNDLGEGCQKAFPVNLYTAKCLHFYVPIREGKEREAVTLLWAINAIPWNPNLAGQVFAYIHQIQVLRDTLYKRAFDPTGWDIKFDQPKGYDMTKYDTTDPNWSAAHETKLKYELLGAFTINVPCGERIDPRPMLCQ